MIEVGSLAPEFTLVADDTKEVNLTDYRGKNVVLLFFPFAFTGVCTKEMCFMRDSMSQMNDWNAQVLGISIDSPFTLAKFKEEEKLNFPLLSDFNKTAIRAYDTIYEEFPAFGLKGVAKRSAYVINKEGIVKYAEICDSPGDEPNYNAMKETLSSLN